MQQQNSITYVANAGVLLEMHGKKILIDGLCKSKPPIYKNPPAAISEQIIRGLPPFDNIDIMLFTHHHSDHFDPISASEFSKHNANTTIISTPEVISEIKNHSSEANVPNLIELNPAPHCREKISVNGVNIQAISMIHDGKEYADVQNLAYLLEKNGTKVLHTGDAGPVQENYAPLDLNRENLDLLITTFPYIGIPAHRQLIEKYINPQKIAVVHLPYRELDSFGWIKATKKSYERVQKEFIPTVFLEEIGDILPLH